MPDSTMDSGRYQRVKSIFYKACELAAEERARFLDEACTGDAALRQEVDSLFEQEDDTSHPLNTPVGLRDVLQAAAETAASKSADEAEKSALPDRIGDYRIIRKIGEGGMGAVFEAEQSSPKRRVALKTMRDVFAAPSLGKRFEHEIQVLGKLQHEGIARIYDAGLSQDESGAVRFFTMELIDGESITTHAVRARLDTASRLRLVAAVCDAVHFAHIKGVIHRDLKPANILVNGDGKPKILDFGVARITDADIRTTTLQTGAGQLIGTIPYMSPEQVCGAPGDLDARSDVYSLGVLLYELLADRLPHEIKNTPIPEAARIIREDDPARLASVVRSLRGDLDTIVHKALEKDRERRYQSAEALGQDIRRHLHDEPIMARRPTAHYQFRKFARRNRGLVIGLICACVALLVGTAGMAWFAWQTAIERDAAKTARDEATLEAERAIQVTKVLEDMLEGVGPSVAMGRDTQLLGDLLDRTAVRAQKATGRRPEVMATLHDIIGRAYQSIERFDEAESHLSEAVRIRRSTLGDLDPLTLESLNWLGIFYLGQHRYDEAESALVETLMKRRKVLGEEHGETLGVMNNLANVYRKQGRYDEAEPLYRRAMELGPGVLGDEHPFTLNFMGNLAILYYRQGRYDEAAPLYEKLLQIRQRVLGDEHPNTLVSMNNLGDFYTHAGRHVEAEELLTRALEGRKRILGERHGGTQSTMNNLAVLYSRQSRFADAIRIHRELLEIRRDGLGINHPRTLSTMHNLSYVLYRQEDYDQAQPLMRSALAGRIGALGDEHPLTESTRLNLSLLLRKVERYQEAEEILLYADTILENTEPNRRRREKIARQLTTLYKEWGRTEKEQEWAEETKLRQ